MVALRFLADESCDFAVVRALRGAGYDVVAVAEFINQSLDSEVIDADADGISACPIYAPCRAEATRRRVPLSPFNFSRFGASLRNFQSWMAQMQS